jgi:putative membrane protein
MGKRIMMSLMSVFILTALAFASPLQQQSSQSQSSDSMKHDKNDKHNKSSQNDSMQNMSSNTTLDSTDRKFVMEAAQGGMEEVSLGHMAVDKATNPDVKQFAQRMIDDHSKANSELMALASQKGVNLPSGNQAMNNQSSPINDSSSSTSDATAQSSTSQTSTSQTSTSQTGTNTTGERHARTDEMMSDQAGMNKLSGLSGADFDREYVNMMVKDHEKDVKEFEKASTKAKDPDVRAWAAKTLPTLRDHLQQVRDIQSRMKSSK